MWQSSNILDRLNSLTRKLRADSIWLMLATVCFRTAAGLLVCCPNMKMSKHTKQAPWPQSTRETRVADIDWINLAENKDQCRTLVKTVTNIRVSIGAVIYLVTSQEGHGSMKLDFADSRVQIY
jgi:hypothetical protein